MYVTVAQLALAMRTQPINQRVCIASSAAVYAYICGLYDSSRSNGAGSGARRLGVVLAGEAQSISVVSTNGSRKSNCGNNRSGASCFEDYTCVESGSYAP